MIYKTNNKFSTLIYNFENLDNIYSSNIGDYIQSIAALNMLGKSYDEVDFINREDLSNSANHKFPLIQKHIIMNGWFSHLPMNSRFNDEYTPLFTSVHLKRNYEFTNFSKEMFKKYEPIGCRDLDSVAKFEKAGIKAYFSSCLTLTFNKDKYFDPEVNDRRILFAIDNLSFDENDNVKWDSQFSGINSLDQFRKWNFSNDLIKILGLNNDEVERSEFISQLIPKGKSNLELFSLANKRLESIANSKMVITTRIHIMMPAIAMGIPAVFIFTNKDDHRFKGLIEDWNYIELKPTTDDLFDIQNNIIPDQLTDMRINKINNSIKNDINLDEIRKNFELTIEKWLKK